MALVNRGDKAGGGKAFQDGKEALASEVNTDFDTVFSLVNGNLDSDNVSGLEWSVLSGQGEAANINDISDEDEDQIEDSSPGTDGSLTNATSLEAELKQLRYAVKRLAVGISPVREDGSGEDVVSSWVEAPYRGPNLIANPRFEGRNSGAEPYDWEIVGTPTYNVVTGTIGERLLNINSDATGEGRKQVVTGLKPSTRYLIKVHARSLSADAKVVTSGAQAGTKWQDFEVTIPAGSLYADYLGVVQTDATPADIEVKILSDASGALITVKEVCMWELGDVPIASKHIHDYTEVFEDDITGGGPTTIGTSVTVLADGNALTSEVRAPTRGYVVKVRGVLNLGSPTVDADGDLSLYLFKDGDQVRRSVTSISPAEPGNVQNDNETVTIEWIDLAPGVAANTYQMMASRNFNSSGTWVTQSSGVLGTFISTELIPMRLEK